MIKILSIFFIGAGLWACSSVNTLSVNSKTEKLTDSYQTNSHIDSLIQPYKDSLSVEMNVIIAEANTDFIVERPGSNLGNWVADAIFVNQTRTVRLSDPVFVLLNTGGLRASLNKGPITIGDIFKLMPFDNELVWVKLPMSVLPEIQAYLIKSGGEPIANAQMEKGILTLNGGKEGATHFWVITSDYLKNGGDKMTFFSKAEDAMLTGKVIRNCLIDEAKHQGVLIEDTVKRINF
jgi:2',3'-cyclic-nucleotide 2'-phosphodiesterase (5'-nucleotidase family)